MRHSSSCGELQDSQRLLRESNKENISVNSSKVSIARTTKSDSDSVAGVRRGGSIPFRDRTNAQEPGRISLAKGSISTAGGEKHSSLKELIPPLNAARLRPIQQQTRSAIVSPLEPYTSLDLCTCTSS